MAQSTITSYFSSRKRAAHDDFKVKSKVLVLDQAAVPLGYDANSTDISSPKQVTQKVIVTKSKPLITSSSEQKPTTRTSSTKVNKSAKQPNLTNFFKKPDCEYKPEETAKENELSTKPTVPFEVRGPLSPVKRRFESTPESSKPKQPEAKVKTEESEVKLNTEEPVAPNEKPKRNDTAVQRARKELSLGDIKTRLNRSSRVAELKERLARIERNREQLAELERKDEKPSTPLPPDASPRLNRFQTIELEVPVTPTKSPLTSPQKLLNSPRNSLCSVSPTKSPAYHRFAALTAPATPENKLILPFSYRLLAELFRCVDLVASMMCNRRETVTFKKLKPAVQEMRRRTFTERHLAQIMTVYPDAFVLSQDKVKSFGSMAKEKYELVITALRKSDNGRIPAEPGTMTPAVLAERHQDFQKRLLAITKDRHDDFLCSLEPPVFLAKERITRWHPEFLVDKVPEVTPAELPVAPGQHKISSAKDVLAHARHLFTANPRMAKALETVAANQEGNTVKVEVVDANSNPPSPAAPPTKPNITSALKGIPKALLEKVRARQAAKALEAMTRSAAEDKEVAQYSRLPEIARILRNCYVVEKKGVMPLETVVEKVANSYRSTLSRGELEEHFKLLAREVPGWLTFDHLRNTDFVRLSKSADMNKVLKKLESLAMQKTGVKL